MKRQKASITTTYKHLLYTGTVGRKTEPNKTRLVYQDDSRFHDLPSNRTNTKKKKRIPVMYFLNTHNKYT